MKFLTKVQHRRGTSSALAANSNIIFAPGELILEKYEESTHVKTAAADIYLARIGTGGNYSAAANLWAYAADVAPWNKETAKGTEAWYNSDGIASSINAVYTQGETNLATAKSYAEGLVNALDYSAQDDDGTFAYSISQTDGKINVLRRAIKAADVIAKDTGNVKLSTYITYVDTLKSTIETSSTGLSAVVASHTTTLSGYGTRIKANEDNISAINETIGSTDIGTDTTLTGAIKALQDTVGTSGGNSLGSRVSAVETKAGNNETAIGNINIKLGDVTYTGASITAAINDAQTNINGHGTRIKANEDAIAGINEDLSDLTGTVQGHTTSINNLVGDDANKSVRTIANEELAAQLLSGNADADFKTLQDLATWLEDHPESVAEINTSITGLNNLTSGHTTTINSHETAIGNINTKLGDVAYTGDSITAAINNAQTRLTNVESKSSNNETAIGDINTELGSVAYTGDSITAAIKAAQTDINGHGTRIKANEDAITGINTKIGEEVYTGASITAAIKTAQTTLNTLTGTGDGSVSKQISTAITASEGRTKETTDTIAEDLSNLTGTVSGNTTAIGTNATSITNIKNMFTNAAFTVTTTGADAGNNILGTLAYTTYGGSLTEITIDCGEIV